VPVFLLFCRSTVLCLKEKAVSRFVQLFGAGCLLMVVFTHLWRPLDTGAGGRRSEPQQRAVGIGSFDETADFKNVQIEGT
jgi:hypothetical protein